MSESHHFPQYQEPLRPRFHFTPPQGWMNDPNGLIYHAGEYHLFYQFIPGTHEHRGPKHWGHAVSRDLLRWENLPVALYPDDLGEIWSGSAVVDRKDSAGLRGGGGEPLVAIFTHERDSLQQQSIAFSTDCGRSWVKFAENPVIPNPGLVDFRDPKVFWHQPSDRWVMVLAAGDRVMLYTSSDLTGWRQSGEFGAGHGAQGFPWECPDLFQLPVDGDPEKQRWVLLVSVNGGSPNGGSGTQYFLGDFDGQTFHNENPPERTLWMDYGRDNYAGITFGDTPDGRRIFLGWMSNWWYAPLLPTAPWRGALTIPRELGLRSAFDREARLISSPLAELRRLRRQHTQLGAATVAGGGELILHQGAPIETLELFLEFRPGSASECGLRIRGEKDELIVLGYDVAQQALFVDRRRSGRVDFSADFAGVHASPPLSLPSLPGSETVRLHLFLDTSSVELFGNDGDVVITDLIFPTTDYDRLEFYAKDAKVSLLSCELWQLASIWGD
jgi:fructan beta-fructosidase